MADKAPCRWVGDDWFCAHPLPLWLLRSERPDVEPPMAHKAYCHGCPCHEPEPAKDTPGCQWEQDWEGNWDASCGLCWVGDDIGGMNFCPNCGMPVTAVPYTEPNDTQRTDPPQVHDKP